MCDLDEEATSARHVHAAVPPCFPSTMTAAQKKQLLGSEAMTPQHAYGTVGDEDTPPLLLRKKSSNHSNFSISPYVAVTAGLCVLVGLVAIAGSSSSSTWAFGGAAEKPARLLRVPQPEQAAAGKKRYDPNGKTPPKPNHPQANVTFILHTGCVDVKAKDTEFWSHGHVRAAYIVRHNFWGGSMFEFKDALRMQLKESPVPGEHGVFELTTDQVNFEWGFAVVNSEGKVLYEVGQQAGGTSMCSYFFVNSIRRVTPQLVCFIPHPPMPDRVHHAHESVKPQVESEYTNDWCDDRGNRTPPCTARRARTPTSAAGTGIAI